MSECPVCFEELDTRMTVTTPCRHSFCLNCLLEFKSHICPICRFDFQENMPVERRPKLVTMEVRVAPRRRQHSVASVVRTPNYFSRRIMAAFRPIQGNDPLEA